MSKRGARAIGVGLVTVLSLCCALGAAQEAGQQKLAITAKERDVVRAILAAGPGERLKVKDFLLKTDEGLMRFDIGGPQPGDWLIVFKESSGGKYDVLSNYQTWNPADSLTGRQRDVPEFLRGLSDGTVIRFVGRVLIEPCTFDGSPDDPLTFMWSFRQGLVYLDGKGSVGWPSGASVTCNGVECSPSGQSGAQSSALPSKPEMQPSPGRIHVAAFDAMANVRIERDWENWPELSKQIRAGAQVEWKKQRIVSHIVFLPPNGELKLASGAIFRGYPETGSEFKFEFLGNMDDAGSGLYTDRCSLVLKRSAVDPARGLDGFTHVFKAGEGDMVYVSGKGRVEISENDRVLNTYQFGK
ncbi:MAG: hypothetical protein ABSH05_14470 [Bryobacteraceae bacterium]